MDLVGYIWLGVAGVFVLVAITVGVSALMDLRHAQETVDGLLEAMDHHPSRPTGPEDEPRWKEWAQ